MHQTAVVPYRRKREGRTNYKKRLTLLKSRTPRLVVRRTNRNIIAQVIEYSPTGDKILCGVNSKELKKLGWDYSAKSLPAAYLTGKYLYSKMHEKNNIPPEIILDLGIHTPVKGNRIYALVKGLKDCGVNIPTSDEIFPPEDRLHGKHITAYYNNKKDKRVFSTYKIDPFDETFKKLSEQFKS